MLSNLSSLLQLFAAMYLTMCFEDSFFKSFWSREYSDGIKTSINSSSIPEVAKKIVAFYIMIVKDAEKRRMKMRGTYFFLLSVFLLIMIGFEKGIVAFTNPFSLSFSYAFFALMIIILYVFDKHVMKRWLWVYLYVFVMLVAFMLLVVKLPNASWFNSVGLEWSFRMKVIAKVLTIIAFVAPVVWQLFSNWLYANLYYRSVYSEVEKEMVLYKAAWNYDGSQDINSIHRRYRNQAVQKYASKSDDEKPFNDVLKDQLKKMTFPNTWRLIRLSIKEFFNTVDFSRWATWLAIVLTISSFVLALLTFVGVI